MSDPTDTAPPTEPADPPVTAAAAWLTFSCRVRHPDGLPLIARELTLDDLDTLVGVLFGPVEGGVLFKDIQLQGSPQPQLFQRVEFTSHAGLPLHWKIECDALTEADWAGLAQIAVERLPAFGKVVGIERGGVPFADALREYQSSGPLLIADDVLTTGMSMLTAREAEWLTFPNMEVIGVVAFARCEPELIPDWITPVFQLGPRSK